MCGRYALYDVNNLKERFNLQSTVGLEGRYNVAPGLMEPVIVGNDTREARLMKWGLVPSWANDPKIGYKMINARAEGIETKPSFRKPFRSQRCLVPANGFYEWKTEDKDKQPYYFYLKDNELLSMAGLYDVWQDAEGRETYSYTLITTEANELMKPIHERMPVVLAPEQEAAWLQDQTPLPQLKALLKPLDSALMGCRRVGDEVNNPRNDSPSLIK